MNNSISEQTFDFFDTAPELDIELSFDQALDRAVADETDVLAFSLLTTHLDRARERGDMTRLFEMSMVLGATACMHDHMQQFSNNYDMFSGQPDSLNRLNASHDHDGHAHGPGKHEHDDDDDDEDAKKKKRKKR